LDGDYADGGGCGVADDADVGDGEGDGGDDGRGGKSVGLLRGGQQWATKRPCSLSTSRHCLDCLKTLLTPAHGCLR